MPATTEHLPTGRKPINPSTTPLYKKTTAYQLFMRAVREDMNRKFGGGQAAADWINNKIDDEGPATKTLTQQKVVMMVIGKLWRDASEDERKPFHEASARLRAEGADELLETVRALSTADVEVVASAGTGGGGESDMAIARAKPPGGGKVRKKSGHITAAGGDEPAKMEVQEKIEIPWASSKKHITGDKAPSASSSATNKDPAQATAAKLSPSKEFQSPQLSSTVTLSKTAISSSSSSVPPKHASSKAGPKPKGSSTGKHESSAAKSAASAPSLEKNSSSAGQVITAISPRQQATPDIAATGGGKSKSHRKGLSDAGKSKRSSGAHKVAGGDEDSAASSGRNSRRAPVIELESEEEMQDDDEPEEEEDDTPREGIGASAAELASIDLELGVEKEWIQVEWEVQKVGKNVEDWMQWFEASVDLRKPVEFDELDRPRWTISYSRCGTLKATKSVVVFLTKDKLLDDFDGVPLNWRKKSDEFQDVVDLSKPKRNSSSKGTSSTASASSTSANGAGGWKDKFFGRSSRRRS